MEKLSSFVFLFDADYPPFSGFYGYKCNTCFAEAISQLTLDPNESISIRIGDLLLDALSRELTKVEKDGKFIKSSYSFDKYLYASLLLDLSHTLSLNWHTFNKEDFFQKGAELNNFHCITISNINHEMVYKLDSFLQTQPFYIGAAELDTGNPLHLLLFIKYLISTTFIKDNKVFYKEDEDAFDWKTFLSSYTITSLDSFDFNYAFPPMPISAPISESGRNTQTIFKNKGKFSHHRKVGEAFLKILQLGEAQRDFKLEIRSNSEDNIIIPEAKLAGYALNLEHKEGGSKAKFFRDVFGIEAKNWRYLAEQIKLGLNDGDVYEIRLGQYGIQYHVDIVITGLNGANGSVRTAWIIRPGESMQFVTIFPTKKVDEDEININERPIMAVPQHLEEKEKWKELFRLADEAGKAAGDKCIPTPVLITGFAQPLAEGKLGRALISFSDKKHEFVQWLNQNNLGHFYKGAYIIVVTHETQSVERAIAYANEFSRVLRANGIDSTIDSYLD